MKDRVFFVTAAGGDVGASIVKCIRQQYPNGKILGSDLQQYIQSADMLDEVIVLPEFSDPEYIVAVKEICLQKDVTHFIPVNEGEILEIARHKDELLMLGIKVLIQSDMLLQLSNSKYETAKYLSKFGIQTPETWRVGKENLTEFPIIAKLDKGCGSRQIEIFYSNSEIKKADLTDKWILQRVVGTPDQEYTMAIFSDGYRKPEYICYKRKLGMGSMSVYVETVNFVWLPEWVEKLAKAFDLRGSINVQFRLEQGLPFVFEINARLSSTVHFRHLMGFQDAIWWIQMLDGEKPNLCSVTTPLIGVKKTGELIFRKK